MLRFFLILTLSVLLFACTREDEQPSYQAKFTYNLEGWESLGKQTLVILDAVNASKTNQEITFKIDVINTSGTVFSKDTTVKFDKSESVKSFQLMIETEGEVREVKVSALQ
jgi:hypothetical protein